jgi:hypothetical protein
VPPNIRISRFSPPLFQLNSQARRGLLAAGRRRSLQERPLDAGPARQRTVAISESRRSRARPGEEPAAGWDPALWTGQSLALSTSRRACRTGSRPRAPILGAVVQPAAATDLPGLAATHAAARIAAPRREREAVQEGREQTQGDNSSRHRAGPTAGKAEQHEIRRIVSNRHQNPATLDTRIALATNRQHNRWSCRERYRRRALARGMFGKVLDRGGLGEDLALVSLGRRRQ